MWLWHETERRGHIRLQITLSHAGREHKMTDVEVPPNIWNQVITAHPHVSGEQRLINSYCVYTLAVKLCICSINFVL